MFRHIVLFKVRADVDNKIINSIFVELENEKKIIPGIIDITWGKTLNSEDSHSYTHAIIMDFIDKSAYQVHLMHPKHKEVQQKLIPLLDGDLKTAVLRFDFEV